ncbi:hypothetical protein GUITHDRAFT_84522 [Guillardia theta CCMP2712]|uniref:Thioredoxin domain-containing protein n=2 Tax=Guillardia theta TaxID=55529 RepID=L1JWJ1_GUITC|nr:hypothetical protein GUITHDRAFT_84522 [Guillardia theta CCMP2712]EKX52941.1 hypothetical protein GUITHDRAFT_84522 [Guillardia theta CCMP2712]|eukprot:XP_005839921.1 hypothetical protein GUITHDRAFT_84522 [Guillardia theta CCMP2712]
MVNAEGGEKSFVKVLTDSTFEHDTQSVTGATTGDWFVEFYAPWCGHCKSLTPTWESLAQKLNEEKEAGDVTPIIAKVDGTVSPKLQERFQIRGFPTLKMFSKGKMYDYMGPRDLDSLYAFAKGGFKKETGAPVPKGWDEMSLFDKASHLYMVTIHRDMESIWEYHKAAFFTGLGFSFFCGMLLGYFLKRSPKAKRE